MMKHMTLEKIALACGGTYTGPEDQRQTLITGAVQDSRRVEPGFLFFAVRGERVDGHSYIPAVFAKGAACCVCETLPEHPAGPCIQNACHRIVPAVRSFQTLVQIEKAAAFCNAGKPSPNRPANGSPHGGILTQNFCVKLRITAA